MAESRQIQSNKSTSQPTFEVLVNGEELPRAYKLVELSVNKEINKIAYAKMLFADGDPATGSFEISDSEWMDNGNEISIACGYESQNDTVFEGVIWKHRIIVRNEQSILQVECKDKAFLLSMTEKNKVWEEMKDSEIIEEIADASAFEKEIESTETTHEKMVQYATTDWDFLVSRAEANGLMVRTENNKLELFSPDLDAEAKLDLTLGATILELDTELDASHQYEAAEQIGWSSENQEVIKEEANESLSEQGSISSDDLAESVNAPKTTSHHNGIQNIEELSTLAKAASLKTKLSKIKGIVKGEGFADIKPGELLELNGVGDKFNGKSFVSAVAHIFKKGNWTTAYQLGLTEEYHLDIFKPKPKSQFIIPVTEGLEIGKVIDLEDPSGEDRVKVYISSFASDTGIWARVASLDAGQDRGTFFRPEIDDEVVLGFLNKDPRNPIILGMLNSSAKPAPISASNDNHEKGIVSRGGSKIIFNDDENAITIETPGGHKVVLSDDDGTILIHDSSHNKIEMSSNGISMESPSDIKVKASGDLILEGINVNIKANAEFKAEGTAAAELSSSGIAKIQGSLVQIN